MTQADPSTSTSSDSLRPSEDAPSTKKRVPNRGSWQPGQSGGGRGRPRSGLALSTAIRERLDPHKVLDLVVQFIDDEKVPLIDRLHVLLPWLHAGYLKPPSTAVVSVEHAPARDYSALSEGELRARLEWLRGQRALSQVGEAIDVAITDENSSDRQLLQPMVPDDDGDRDTRIGTQEALSVRNHETAIRGAE